MTEEVKKRLSESCGEAYGVGYNDAVKKACAWINNNLTQYFSDPNLRFKVMENFLKDMEI